MTDKKESAKADAGKAQAQSTMDRWHEVGARGVPVDPTPNEAYTVAGVTKGAATPETDLDAEAKARGASGPIAAAKADAEALEKASDRKPE